MESITFNISLLENGDEIPLELAPTASLQSLTVTNNGLNYTAPAPLTLKVKNTVRNRAALLTDERKNGAVFLLCIQVPVSSDGASTSATTVSASVTEWSFGCGDTGNITLQLVKITGAAGWLADLKGVRLCDALGDDYGGTYTRTFGDISPTWSQTSYTDGGPVAYFPLVKIDEDGDDDISPIPSNISSVEPWFYIVPLIEAIANAAGVCIVSDWMKSARARRTVTRLRSSLADISEVLTDYDRWDVFVSEPIQLILGVSSTLVHDVETLDADNQHSTTSGVVTISVPAVYNLELVLTHENTISPSSGVTVTISLFIGSTLTQTTTSTVTAAEATEPTTVTLSRLQLLNAGDTLFFIISSNSANTFITSSNFIGSNTISPVPLKANIPPSILALDFLSGLFHSYGLRWSTEESTSGDVVRLEPVADTSENATQRSGFYDAGGDTLNVYGAGTVKPSDASLPRFLVLGYMEDNDSRSTRTPHAERYDRGEAFADGSTTSSINPFFAPLYSKWHRSAAAGYSWLPVLNGEDTAPRLAEVMPYGRHMYNGQNGSSSIFDETGGINVFLEVGTVAAYVPATLVVDTPTAGVVLPDVSTIYGWRTLSQAELGITPPNQSAAVTMGERYHDHTVEPPMVVTVKAESVTRADGCVEPRGLDNFQLSRRFCVDLDEGLESTWVVNRIRWKVLAKPSASPLELTLHNEPSDCAADRCCVPSIDLVLVDYQDDDLGEYNVRVDMLSELPYLNSSVIKWDNDSTGQSTDIQDQYNTDTGVIVVAANMFATFTTDFVIRWYSTSTTIPPFLRVTVVYNDFVETLFDTTDINGSTNISFIQSFLASENDVIFVTVTALGVAFIIEEGGFMGLTPLRFSDRTARLTLAPDCIDGEIEWVILLGDINLQPTPDGLSAEVRVLLDDTYTIAAAVPTVCGVYDIALHVVDGVVAFTSR